MGQRSGRTPSVHRHARLRRGSEPADRASSDDGAIAIGPADRDGETDEALVERLQRSAFGYFEQYVNPRNGLVADTSRPGSPASIAVVGFALSAYVVAVERGWMPREAAADRVLTTLRFLKGSPQGATADVSGHRGFYYHFLDMESGRRVWDCELSLIDSTLLMAGILTAGRYFDAGGRESEIAELADSLYRRVDWRWAQNDSATLAQGWKPECGFLHYGWEGYNEATILYALGLGSPTHPLTDGAFETWTLTYQWEHLLGQDVLYCGPLFTHLFSHAWIDFRGIRDAFMREKDTDYFENTRHTIAVHREYCARNPHDYVGYSRDVWGISAGDGPVDARGLQQPRDDRHFGYMARGAPYGPDDGTLCPWAMLATLPFEPEAALRGTRTLLSRYPQVCRAGRFSSGYNPTLATSAGGWLSEGWYGLDQGLLVLSIENARSGLIWKLLRRSTDLRHGLTRAGFGGGWLGT
jgi:hypothetical protein